MHCLFHSEAHDYTSWDSRRSLVLYDDLLSAETGFDFALSLNSEVGIDIGSPERHCPLERLEIPTFATELAREALNASYVILSLRGDTELSTVKEQWLEEWLTNPRAHSVGLIVLFDPVRQKVSRVSKIKRWLEETARLGNTALFFFGAEEPQSVAPMERTRVSTIRPSRDETREWSIGGIDRLLGTA